MQIGSITLVYELYASKQSWVPILKFMTILDHHGHVLQVIIDVKIRAHIEFRMTTRDLRQLQVDCRYEQAILFDCFANPTLNGHKLLLQTSSRVIKLVF